MEYGKNLGDGVWRVVGRLDSCDYQIGADCHPEMGLDCVLRIAPQRLDDDVLLDPLEEDLDLPSVAEMFATSNALMSRLLVMKRSVSPLSGSRYSTIRSGFG